MKPMVRCKVCGYIMSADKLGDKCPACGALRTVFEPYTDIISESRKKVLGLHLHPIAVHFPTSFAVAVLVFTVAALFSSGQAQNLLSGAIKIMVLLLPLIVIIAVLTGILDGMTRFRHIKRSDILKRKIIYGVSFFVLSLALTLIIWLKGIDNIIFTSISIVIEAGTIIFIVLLSTLGMSITNSALPGK